MWPFRYSLSIGSTQADSKLRHQEDGEGVVLLVEVNENPMISSVEVVGNDKIRANAIIEAQNLAKGGFYAELYNSQFEGCE